MIRFGTLHSVQTEPRLQMPTEQSLLVRYASCAEDRRDIFAVVGSGGGAARNSSFASDRPEPAGCRSLLRPDSQDQGSPRLRPPLLHRPPVRARLNLLQPACRPLGLAPTVSSLASHASEHRKCLFLLPPKEPANRDPAFLAPRTLSLHRLAQPPRQSQPVAFAARSRSSGSSRSPAIPRTGCRSPSGRRRSKSSPRNAAGRYSGTRSNRAFAE